jgi:hypothetical protein
MTGHRTGSGGSSEMGSAAIAESNRDAPYCHLVSSLVYGSTQRCRRLCLTASLVRENRPALGHSTNLSDAHRRCASPPLNRAAAATPQVYLIDLPGSARNGRLSPGSSRSNTGRNGAGASLELEPLSVAVTRWGERLFWRSRYADRPKRLVVGALTVDMPHKTLLVEPLCLCSQQRAGWSRGSVGHCCGLQAREFRDPAGGL